MASHKIFVIERLDAYEDVSRNHWDVLAVHSTKDAAHRAANDIIEQEMNAVWGEFSGPVGEDWNEWDDGCDGYKCTLDSYTLDSEETDGHTITVEVSGYEVSAAVSTVYVVVAEEWKEGMAGEGTWWDVDGVFGVFGEARDRVDEIVRVRYQGRYEGDLVDVEDDGRDWHPECRYRLVARDVGEEDGDWVKVEVREMVVIL